MIFENIPPTYRLVPYGSQCEPKKATSGHFLPFPPGNRGYNPGIQLIIVFFCGEQK
jgi:hypothetical protein